LRLDSTSVLYFVDGRERPEYAPSTNVERVGFDRPSTRDPAPGKR
jgi:hypothetical protein